MKNKKGGYRRSEEGGHKYTGQRSSLKRSGLTVQRSLRAQQAQQWPTAAHQHVQELGDQRDHFVLRCIPRLRNAHAHGPMHSPVFQDPSVIFLSVVTCMAAVFILNQADFDLHTLIPFLF